eukprot:TRINITY_DN7888_c0_g1_i2.p1 TRINITY_DN7888_c0_g1~~TRINITY_DN7888_c0_g1_i2.p1  ORF type:complete len:103 (-),score=17.15 TRINITY_DN7888_c0_g1_i2:1-309(-)
MMLLSIIRSFPLETRSCFGLGRAYQGPADESDVSGVINVLECDFINNSPLKQQYCPPKDVLSRGAIVGIVIGSVAFVALIVTGVILFIRHKRFNRKYTMELL